MEILSKGASIGRNFNKLTKDGIVNLVSPTGEKIIYTIKDGDVIEQIYQNKYYKIHTKYGEFKKIYNDKNILLEEKYYSKNERILPKGLFLRKRIDGFIIERYASCGKMDREKVFYTNSKKSLLYDLSRRKTVEIFNPNGSIKAKILRDEKFSLSSNLKKMHINIFGLEKMALSFSGKWRYELYDKKGNIHSYLEGIDHVVTDGVRNGKKLYFLKGIGVSENLAKGKYNAQDILSMSNVTIRTELIKRYGLEKIISEVHGQVIDKNNEYELISILANGGVIKILKMICPSTNNESLIRVHPDCKTVDEAVQWTYGVNLNVYKPNMVDIIKAT